MRTQDVTFHSDGLALSGSWFLPDAFEDDAEHPVVIPCSGFTGLKDAHPARFARFLTARGHLCFGFDYRGFAGSEGPTRRVVLDAARGLSGVVGVLAVNGFYRGRRVQRAHRTPGGLRAFEARVREDRRRRAATGRAAVDDAFTFYPLDEEPEARSPAPKPASEPQAHSGMILVVEDDDSVRRVSTKILEQAGFPVIGATDAESAVELLDELDDLALVLTDLGLPAMSGRELADRIRTTRPGLPVLVMSGYAEDSPGHTGDLLVDIPFLQKPFTPERLMHAVHQALEGGVER